MKFIVPAATLVALAATAPSPSPPLSDRRNCTMQDLLWIGIMGGLLAATLAYVRLCDRA
jgi:hypothetical protein